MTDEEIVIGEAFDPTRYLTKVNGSAYLEVKHRLVWLRSKHPDAIIETECLQADAQVSMFRCKITIPGGGSATGHGSETPGDFRDHYEKSETKSIGRALAALGFGTQFCPDHEFGASVGRVVDSPVKARGNGYQRVDGAEVQAGTASSGPSQPATQRQLNYLSACAREAGLDPATLDERCVEAFGVPSHQLTRAACSAMIEELRGSVVRVP